MYEKQTWVDGVSIANAERLNHIEDGIRENSENVSTLEEKSKINIMQITQEKGQTIIATDFQNRKINCELDLSIGNKLTYEDYSIKIGKGVKFVKVSGAIFLNNKSGSSTTYAFGKITKNGEDVAHTIMYSNSVYISTPIAEKLVEVKEDDIFSLYIELSDGQAVTRTDYGSTYLKVEVVE